MANIILSILFQGIDFFLRSYAANEQQKRDYIAFLEIMSRKGIKSASNRLAAQEQIDAVKKLWEKEKQTP
jgi:hypothetical protein